MNSSLAFSRLASLGLPSSVTALADGAGVNYVNSKLLAVDGTPSGAGVVACEAIFPGESLVVYGGMPVTLSDLKSIPEALHPYFYQIAHTIWYGPGLSTDSLGIGERINHSCDPNGGFRSPTEFIALRKIEPGEMVTVDYAYFTSQNLEGSEFFCSCGSHRCRRIVRSTDYEVVGRHEGQLQRLQPFLEARLVGRRSPFSELIFPQELRRCDMQAQRGWGLISPKVNTPRSGASFATAGEPLQRREVAFVLGGRVVPGEQYRAMAPELRRFYRPVAAGCYLGPASLAEVSLVDSLSRSLAPNLTRVHDLFLVTTRPVIPGEPLTVGSR